MAELGCDHIQGFQVCRPVPIEAFEEFARLRLAATNTTRMAFAPVLTTARLRLRPHVLADYDAACAMWADPIVTQFIGGKPSTPQQTWARLLTYVGHWQVLGFGYWAIESKATGVFIGEIGFADFHRDIIPAMRGVPELGFALASSEHGNGYATEAVGAVLSWGDEHLL